MKPAPTVGVGSLSEIKPGCRRRHCTQLIYFCVLGSLSANVSEALVGSIDEGHTFFIVYPGEVPPGEARMLSTLSPSADGSLWAIILGRDFPLTLVLSPEGRGSDWEGRSDFAAPITRGGL